MIVGITGGIGCGKSTVLKLFEQRNIPTFSSDKIAQQLLMPGNVAFNTVIEHFGASYLELDGTLNRKSLRKTIFSDPNERLWLESLLHPLIKQEIQKQSALVHKNTYCVIEIPLLIEAQFQDCVDRILVIDCPQELQIERVKARDSASLIDLTPMLNSQINREARLAIADDIIDNSSTELDLKQQVIALHQTYIKLSTSSQN